MRSFLSFKALLRLSAFACVTAAIVLLFGWQRWLENRHDPVILAAAQRYGVHPALVKALIWQESRFDAAARGSRGEMGLMQLMEASGREWAQAEHHSITNHESLLDPALNTQAGTWYLKRAWGRYQHCDNPLPYALAEYNAGRGNVLRWARGVAATNAAAFTRQITYPSTQSYVYSVIRRYNHYASAFPAVAQSR